MRTLPVTLIASLSLVACGDHRTTGDGGTDASGDGQPIVACSNVPNAPGAAVDLAWPAVSNVGHDAVEGNTVHFHWSGMHNVLQVATFTGQVMPTPTLGDAHWPNEIRSGDSALNGSFDWNTGIYPCGYRPGIYFFVDENNPSGGVVSLSLTVDQNVHVGPRPCGVLSDSRVFGGRYAQYAHRPGCTLYEVNNFQTEAHFDWVPPAFGVQQGDLVLFRWTGEHNVVQVHDVTQDTALAGGINSGTKSNCVGGPDYSCVNGPDTLGEYLFDSANHRPGTVHISDECALRCTGHTTGMNMEFNIHAAIAPSAGACCAIDPTKGTACRVIEITNSNDGAQLDYNVPAGQGDLVRFRWAGRLQITQTTPNANGSPSSTPRDGGVGMPAPVECTPGPNMSCLEGTDATAQFVFDVAAAVANHAVEDDGHGNQFFDFHAVGENTPGFTSADTGTIVYIDRSVPFDPHPAPCP